MWNRKLFTVAVSLLAASVMLIGGTADIAHSAKMLTDSEISLAVDDQLMQDPATPADHILVSTLDGIVTLSGSVNNILAKDRAATIAQTVKGVRGIVNRIAVAAPFRSDTAIQEDVDQALMQDPATESWEISADVNDSVVTLNGSVESWQEKKLAAKVSKGVRGVKGIDNNIAVDYTTGRSDAEIRAEIKKTLRWDAYVDDALVNVSVDDGNVSLAGIVGSMAEKSRARADAWVVGVKSVDNTDLEVKYWARDGKLRKDKYMAKSEPEIESAVKDTLGYDPRVDTSDITVKVDGGIATLRGTVDDLKEKRVAGKNARNVVGVWGVRNRIKIDPGISPTDSTIESRVEAALLGDPYVEYYEIDVEVADGNVYLYGEVDSYFEKAQADDLAARQNGVVDVNNYLTVHDTDAATYDPYMDDWYLYDYDWYDPYESDQPSVGKTDWEIEQNIEDEFFWSPFVDGDDITVQVEDGVAELTGTVDTWSEREAAEENARQGGAVIVDNDLLVLYGPEYYKK